MEAANRKLIRPALQELKEQMIERKNPNRKASPPEQTNAENFYYAKQVQTRTQMVLVLKDGEEVHGVLDWYDKCCLKLTRVDGASLLVYKPSIKYMYKAV